LAGGNFIGLLVVVGNENAPRGGEEVGKDTWIFVSKWDNVKI